MTAATNRTVTTVTAINDPEKWAHKIVINNQPTLNETYS